MSAVNPIDWALDLLSRSRLPPETSAAEFQQRMDELRTLKANGVTEDSLHCPAPGCGYVCFASPGAGAAQPDVCPHHSVPLVLMTWKQMAERAFAAAHEQAEEFDQRMMTLECGAGAMVAQAQQNAREAVAQLDVVRFRQGNEEGELERLRELTAGPIGTFARRMEREIQENAHKGDWDDWTPSPVELLGEVQHHLDKLKLALGKDNRLAVAEFSADVANFMMKLSQLYGAP